jgi:folate-binding protein YgfZ
MWRSPLYETHQRLGATFVQTGEWEVPERYQSLEASYRSAQKSVAMVDRTSIGRLEMAGPDALDLLNRLSTNLTDPIPIGCGTTTVLITPKGRIIDWLTVLHPSEEYLVLLTSSERVHTVAEWIEKYTIVEEITLRDLTHETVQICLLGPASANVLEEALAVSLSELPLYGCLRTSQPYEDLLVARTDPLGLPGFDLVAPVHLAEELWNLIIKVGKKTRMALIGEKTWETLRIQAGIPRWGTELTERYNPLEANLYESISWDKGCYIGQEVVARLNTYHKVQRYLVGISFGNAAPMNPTATLSVEGVPAGALTSLVTVPGSNKLLGLGYLRANFVKLGSEVTVIGENGKVVAGNVIVAPDVAEALMPASLFTADEEDGD